MGKLTHRLNGQVIVSGHGRGPALVTDQPFSFWGGLNPDTGEIIDRRHPLSGECLTGRILVLPHGRGSCSASGVLLEAIRNRTAPAGIIISRIDPIIGLGAILADELYDQPIPVILLSSDQRESLRSGDIIRLEPDGSVTVEAPERAQ